MTQGRIKTNIYAQSTSRLLYIVMYKRMAFFSREKHTNLFKNNESHLHESKQAYQ